MLPWPSRLSVRPVTREPSGLGAGAVITRLKGPSQRPEPSQWLGLWAWVASGSILQSQVHTPGRLRPFLRVCPFQPSQRQEACTPCQDTSLPSWDPMGGP